MVRAKGFFWLATRPDYVGELSQAGALVRTNKRGRWWSAVPRSYWPVDPDWHQAMQPYLDAEWGDRRQEIVFIGVRPMDKANMIAELDACLVPEQLLCRKTGESWPTRFQIGQRQPRFYSADSAVISDILLSARVR